MAYENHGAKMTVIIFKRIEKRNVWIRLTVRAKVVNTGNFQADFWVGFIFFKKKKIL